jgi:hypothetical protein
MKKNSRLQNLLNLLGHLRNLSIGSQTMEFKEAVEATERALATQITTVLENL